MSIPARVLWQTAEFATSGFTHVCHTVSNRFLTSGAGYLVFETRIPPLMPPLACDITRLFWRESAQLRLKYCSNIYGGNWDISSKNFSRHFIMSSEGPNIKLQQLTAYLRGLPTCLIIKDQSESRYHSKLLQSECNVIAGYPVLLIRQLG